MPCTSGINEVIAWFSAVHAHWNPDKLAPTADALHHGRESKPAGVGPAATCKVREKEHRNGNAQGLHRHQRLHQGADSCDRGPRPRDEEGHQGRRLLSPPPAQQVPWHDLPAGLHPHPRLVRDRDDRPRRSRRVLWPRHHPAWRPRVAGRHRPRHGFAARHHDGPRQPSPLPRSSTA